MITDQTLAALRENGYEKLAANAVAEIQMHTEEMAAAWMNRTGNMDPRSAKIVQRWRGAVLEITIEARDTRVCDHPCNSCDHEKWESAFASANEKRSALGILPLSDDARFVPMLPVVR